MSCTPDPQHSILGATASGTALPDTNAGQELFTENSRNEEAVREDRPPCADMPPLVSSLESSDIELSDPTRLVVPSIDIGKVVKITSPSRVQIL